MKRLVTVIGVMIVCLLPIAVQAADGTLTWVANTESDLAGYKVYFGTGASVCSGTSGLVPLLIGGSPVVLGKVTTYQHIGLPNMDGVMCWELTAYDATGNESTRSNRVSKTVNLVPPLPPTGLGVVIP